MLNKIIILFLLSLLTLSCSNDLKKSEIKKEKFSLPLSCEIDSDAFSNIVKENIEPEIDCLGETFEFFIEAVKTDRPGYLSKKELLNFAKQQMPEQVDNLNVAVKAMFYVGQLMFAEDGQYLHGDHVKDIIDILKVVNREIISIYFNLVTDKLSHPLSYHQKKRSEGMAAVEKIVESMKKVFKKERTQVDKVSILDFLQLFQTDKNFDTIEVAKSFLFAKKLLIGGESHSITHTEFLSIIENLPHLVSLAFDIIRFEKISFENEAGWIEFFKAIIVHARENIIQKDLNTNEVIFTTRELLNGLKSIKRLEPDMIDFSPYKDLALEVKELLVGKGEGFTGHQLNGLLDEAQQILSQAQFVQETYQYFSSYIEGEKGKLDPKLKPPGLGYSLESFPVKSAQEDAWKKELIRVLENYRVFKVENQAPIYSNQYERSLRGVLEIRLVEYLLKKVIVFYENKMPCDSSIFPTKFRCEKEDYSATITKYQIENLINKFSPLLIELEVILPGKEIAMAENITLMSALFQFQSNGDSLVDVPEVTEFLVAIMAGSSFGGTLFESFEQECPVNKERVDVACFRKNFFDNLWNNKEIDYRKFLPRLFQAVNKLDIDEQVDLIASVSQFARACYQYSDGEEIPYNKGDMLSVFGGMLFIESTLLRFDENSSNVMEWWEVEKAYKTNFKTAIAGFLPESLSDNQKYKIFQYLIKKMKIPKTIQALGWLLFKPNKKKRSDADRMTFASIIKIIRIESEKSREEKRGIPPYNCDFLRER